ncbi:MAG: SecY family transport protein, partial [Verrucomicrobiota bacterium]|nr:SecY family transport protein [Verrucomicrobiota bacterium]
AILGIFPMIGSKLPWQWAKEWANTFPMSFWYMFFFGLMILFFSYFWVATQFNPIQIADDLKRRGGYIPGIRPGRPTAEFLDKTMTRLTLAGAVFLTAIAVMPSVMTSQFQIPWIVASFFGGTSLLIIVGVMLDTMRQIESHLLMRHYDGFLKKGKMRSGR